MSLVGLFVLVTYGIGVWLFWKGFRKTFLNQTFSTRLMFAFSWPLWLISRGGRQHLGRALKGS